MKKRINYNKVFNTRIDILIGLIIILFLIILFRLFSIMIINGLEYKMKLSDLNSNYVSFYSSPRGRILDRNYKVLVDNKAVKTITFKKDKSMNKEYLIELAYMVSDNIDLDFSRITDRIKREFYLDKYPDKCNKLITNKEEELYKQKKLSNKDILELKIKRISDEEINGFSDSELEVSYLYYLMNKGYNYEEKIIKSNVSEEEYAYIAEENIDGFSIKTDWERVYPYGDVFRSILGTVSSSEQGIPLEEKDYYLSKGYSLNERVGLSYLEKQYEEYLRGEKDLYKVIDSFNTKLVKNGSRGKDIVLSIDIDLQIEIEKILEEEIRKTKTEVNTKYYDHSTVIIQEPKTGEILAMASKKIINNDIVDNTTSILTSPITPGSVVKGASMLVGYNTNSIEIGEYMLDECIKVIGVNEKCSSHTLGWINDITALAKSSNVYQFKTAIRVSGQEYFRNMRLAFNQEAFDTYRKMYHSFGLGVKTGIDLPIESLGYTAKDHSAGNLLDFVMGQYETYTPIQLSQYITTIANNGKRLKPHLLKEVRNSSIGDELEDIYYSYEPVILNTIDTKSEYLDRVKEGFYAVMNSQGGYGVGYIDKKYSPAGKTGTSQSFLDTDNDGRIDTETITSSFIGYVPSENPLFSIMVTSPDSSYPNTNSDFASFVTLRITKAVTNKYFEMFNLT